MTLCFAKKLGSTVPWAVYFDILLLSHIDFVGYLIVCLILLEKIFYITHQKMETCSNFELKKTYLNF